MTIRILYNGAAGKMGRLMTNGMLGEDDMQLVAAVDVQHVGEDAGTLCGRGPCGVLIENDLTAAIERVKPDVMLDFTSPHAIQESLRIALTHGVACVVGTTGITDECYQMAEELSVKHNAPVFACANYAITCVLMMKFAAEAARYFPNYEIIEIHDDKKLDAPSGTAIEAARMIARERSYLKQGHPEEFEVLPGARGGEFDGARIHSIRVPGVESIHEVFIGGPGQTLSIRHDATNFSCFWPGVALALRKVQSLHGLTVGLDQIMD